MSEIVDISKANEFIEFLKKMTPNELGYTFENMNYDGLLEINRIIAHVLCNIAENVKAQINNRNH